MGIDQLDLFGQVATAAPAALVAAPIPPVPGLDLATDILTPEEQAALIAKIEGEQLTPFRFQRWEGKRLTRSFGWNYDFASGRMEAADPLPAWLLPYRDRAAAFAKLGPDEFVQALLIRYDPGAGIGWHKDRPVFEHVVGISLGSPATLRLRRRSATGFDRAKVQLPPRSIYHLQGEVRHLWQHSIVPMEVPRWSITLRSLARH